MTPIEADQIIRNITARPYVIETSIDGPVFTFQLYLNRPDSDTGVWDIGTTGPQVVADLDEIGEGQLVQRVLGACLRFAEHEVRESFHYEGARVFGPHINLRHLMAAAQGLVWVDGAGVIETQRDRAVEVMADALEAAGVPLDSVAYLAEDEPCRRCDGCGQIADSEDGEPWTLWASLPPGSDLAVRAGIVKPIPCPECQEVSA